MARAATRAGALLFRRKAKENVRVDTGEGRKGIILRSRRGDRRDEVIVAVGPSTRVFYLFFLEFGTRFMRAFPWLRPAFDAMKEKAARVVMDRVWQEVAKEFAKIRKR